MALEKELKRVTTGTTEVFDIGPPPDFPHEKPTLSKVDTFLSFFKTKERDEYEHMAAHMNRSSQREITIELAEWSCMRAWLYKMFEHPCYSAAIGVIIVVNAIVVILETDQKSSEGEVDQWIGIISHCFLGIYAFEILLRFYVFRMSFFQSGWNCLDLFVVITDSCLEVSKLWNAKEVPSVSVLRIFRLARLIRLIAMLSAFHELQTMLLGFGSAMKAIFWASFMIFVVLTVCSICAVEFIHPLNRELAEAGVYSGCDRCGRAFETVMNSNLTFIQQIIAGDSWGVVTIPIIEAYPAAGVFFLLVFGLIDLGLLNLILTVIVNAAEAARTANHEIQLREKAAMTEKMKLELQRLCGSLDQDDDGRISKREFLNGVEENFDLRKTLAMLDIQKQDCETIYHLMDADESGDVDYNEFVHVILSTKFETLNTKILFLRATLAEVLSGLKEHERIMKHEIASEVKGSKDLGHVVAHVVNEGMRRSFSEVQFETLMQKFDWRWEQLQVDQAKNFQMLEKVSMHLSRQGGFGNPMSPGGSMEVRESQGNSVFNSARPSVFSVPPSCTRCEVADKTAPISSSNGSDKRENKLINGLELEASKAGTPTSFFFPTSPLSPAS